MTKLSINAEYVRLAHGFCSTDDARHYLKGVQVEPHPSGQGVLIIAVDGHVAGVLYDRAGYADKNYLLALDKPTIAALKSEKGEKKNRLITIKNDRLTVADNEGREFHIKPNAIEIDGTFPDWRRVIPTEFKGELPASVAAEDLKPFIAVGKSLCNNGHMVLTPSVGNGPISCKIPHRDFMGVIMRIRSAIEGASVDWLDVAGDCVNRDKAA